MVAALKVYFLLVIGLTISGFLAFMLLHHGSNNNQDPSVLHATTTSGSPFSGHSPEQLHCVVYELTRFHGDAHMGEQRYKDIEAGAQFAPEEYDKAGYCLENNAGTTLPPEPGQHGDFSQMTTAVENCWKSRIGNLRFEHIVNIGFEPMGNEYPEYINCLTENPPPPDDESDTTSGSGSSGTGSDTTYSTVGERFPSGSPQENCVKNTLGADFTWFNNKANPNATGEYERFHNLEDKARKCFEDNPPPPSDNEPQYFLSPVMISCLKKAVGESRFEEISSGKSDPTPAEAEKGDLCFEKYHGVERPKVEYSSNETLDKETESCLKLAVGDKRFGEISTGKTPTTSEIKKGKECFGDSSSPFVPPAILKIDTKIKSCITTAINKDRLAQIKAGEVEPSNDERSKANACFAKINNLQLLFLPIPPDQVPFLKVDSSLASIKGVKTTYQKATSGKEQPVATYTGAGSPNSTMDLYFFSDPIVVTVDTDANGVWSYNLDVPLESGDHISYVAAKTSGGEAVRSDVFRFGVAQAEATDGREGGLIVQSSNFTDQLNDYLVWVIGLVVVGVVGVVSIVIYRNRKKKQQLPSQQMGM